MRRLTARIAETMALTSCCDEDTDINLRNLLGAPGELCKESSERTAVGKRMRSRT